MPAITIEAVTIDPMITCGYCHRTYGFVSNAHRLVSSARP
jgi:hypothetical protein